MGYNKYIKFILSNYKMLDDNQKSITEESDSEYEILDRVVRELAKQKEDEKVVESK